MTNQTAMRAAAVLGFLAVALGAFGAHGLHDLLDRNGKEEVWRTAVFYHLAHALILVFIASRRPLDTGMFTCFLAGVLVFSGSLYVLALTNVGWLGAITPFGGLSLLAGWLWLAVKGWKSDAASDG